MRNGEEELPYQAHRRCQRTSHILNALKILDKKVKKNPKYDAVKSVVSTGKTMKDVEIMSNTFMSDDLPVGD